MLRRITAVLAMSMLCFGMAQAQDIRIGFMPYLAYSGMLYAKHLGWVEEEVKKARQGANVQWKQFVAGAPVSEALAANELDVAMLGAAPAIIGRASGQDTRVVALASTGPETHALVVRKSLNIVKIEQLKGRKLATTFGSTVYELMIRALAEGGLSPSDVQLLNMTPPDMGIALRSGTIDGAVIWDPLLPQLLKDGSVAVLRSGQGINDNINLLVGRAAYIQKDQVLVVALVRAIARANEAIRSNPKAVASALAPTFGLSVDDTEAALRRYDFSLTLSPPLRAQLARSVQFMLENKVIRKDVSLDAFIAPVAL